MVSKTLLKLSVPVLSIMIVSACGYIKDIKEKLNPHESPVNARTEEPANPTGEEVNPSSKPADLNNDRSTSEEDDSNTVNGNVKSKDSNNNDLNTDKPINKKIPSKGPTNN